MLVAEGRRCTWETASMDPTLSVFTRAVARESAPASGSAAAVAVAMAAALAQKVAERSEGSAREFAVGMDIDSRRGMELAEADEAAELRSRVRRVRYWRHLLYIRRLHSYCI